MSSKIDSQRSSGLLPWDGNDLDEVRRIRSAITNQLEESGVDDDVAPMMGEFLARMEEWVGELDDVDMVAPSAPDPSRYPTPEERAVHLGRALQTIRRSIEAQPEQAGRFQKMLTILEEYAALKQEIVQRADASSSA